MILLREGSAGSRDAEYRELVSDGPRHLMFFPSSPTADWFYRSGMPERDIIQSVARFVGDSVFLDIGAHVGTYTFSLRARHTHAFECTPATFCHLAANVALHGLADRVTLHQLALGDRNGEIDLYRRSDDGGGNGVRRLVDGEVTGLRARVATLDSLGLSDIGLVKIDVEGGEREVLLGARETLFRSGLPPILFESWGTWKEADNTPASVLRRELFEVVSALGYKVKEIAPDMFLAQNGGASSVSR